MTSPPYPCLVQCHPSSPAHDGLLLRRVRWDFTCVQCTVCTSTGHRFNVPSERRGNSSKEPFQRAQTVNVLARNTLAVTHPGADRDRRCLTSVFNGNRLNHCATTVLYQNQVRNRLPLTMYTPVVARHLIMWTRLGDPRRQ